MKTKTFTKHGEAKVVRDHYAEITDKLIASIQDSLDNGSPLSWHKPWKSLGVLRNGKSGHKYRGINTIILAFTPYADPRWYSFNQIKEMGGNVKGQKSTMILRPFPVVDKQTKEVSFIRFSYFPVFNKEQISGVEFPTLEYKTDNQRNQDAEEVIKATGANISFGGDRACYIPSTDKINMPEFEAFESADHYYSTTFHELAHFSGHESRLNRDLTGRFGSENYAMEELVAELTASFVCRDLEINTMARDDHASYLKSWLKVLQNDTKAIFRAATLAEEAANFILGDKKYQEQTEEEEATEAVET